MLAMATDRRTVCAGYDPNHRCWSTSPPAVRDRHHQLSLCLSGEFRSCEFFDGRAASEPAVSPDTSIDPRRLVVEADAGWRALATRSPSRRPRLLALGAASLTILIASLGAGTGVLGHVGEFVIGLQQAAREQSVPMTAPGSQPASAAGTPTDDPSPTDDPVPIALPSIDLTPVPVPSDSPSATPLATVAPPVAATPPPSATQRYVVQSGDTLQKIARLYGVSIAALQQANGISDQNVITVGQVLVIP
jgi:LysM repeat protein